MKKNLISIIIPVYNTAIYLDKCLTSVCNQTFSDLEIIIVNDGSTDNSSEIINKYMNIDSRIVVINQQNRGISAARNSGLKIARGNFIAFLDSDDWLDIDCCEKAILTAEETKADVVLWSYQREFSAKTKQNLLFDDFRICWDKTNIENLYRRMVGLIGEELKEPQKIDSLITVWGKLYRKDVIGENRFVDTKIIGTEDALFNIQVFSGVNNATYIPDSLSHYRKDNMSSFTHSYKKKLVIQWKELYRRIKEQLDEKQMAPVFYHALSNRICLGLIGLGLNLAEDSSMTFKEKQNELKSILKMSHYQKALNELEIQYMPINWRTFFLFARMEWTIVLYGMLCIMNYLRGK